MMTVLNKALFRFCPLFFISVSIGADKGIDYYNNNEFEKARQYYESVIMDRNNDPAANFGLGVTAFQQQDYAAAMKGFETALGTDNNELKSSAYYNMANILAQNQRLEESLAFFRKSLELKPNDLDAKINYELIKFQLQQQQEQNQDQNQNQDENNKDDEQTGDQKKQEQQKDKQQQEQNEQNDSSDEEESEQQSNQNEDQREDQSQQQQQDMAEKEKQESQDKQNATAILDALKKNEKINKKQQISRMKKRKLEKDW